MQNGFLLALLGVVFAACTSRSKQPDVANSRACRESAGSAATAGACGANTFVRLADSGSADAASSDDQPAATSDAATTADAVSSDDQPAATSDTATTADAATMPDAASGDAATVSMTQADAGIETPDAASGYESDAATTTDAGRDTRVRPPDAGVVNAKDSGSTRSDAGTDAGTDAAPPLGLCASCGGCEQSPPLLPGVHTADPVAYPDPPPTSGAHNPCWASWGVHDTATAPEHWVHNLEHGGVVYLYSCPNGCASDVDQLKLLVGAHQRTVLTAYDQLPKRFAVVSWGHRLVTDCVDTTAFNAFYAAHFDKASESNGADPPAGCLP